MRIQPSAADGYVLPLARVSCCEVNAFLAQNKVNLIVGGLVERKYKDIQVRFVSYGMEESGKAEENNTCCTTWG